MQLYGLIGFPLSHSFSKAYFTEKFQELGLADYVYENFPLPRIEEFPKLLATHPNLTGLNVTIPYKESVMPYLDTVSPDADRIGAVNTICFESSGLKGYNTDWIGFRDTLLELLAGKKKRKHALILGTGGASKAVAFALREMSIPYTLVSRRRRPAAITYDEVTPERMETADLIVNTTPLGMSPDTQSYPHLPYEAVTNDHIFYDLVYNPEETLFLQKGKAQGAVIQKGLDMLRHQAEESWKLWQRHSSGFVF